MANDNYVCPAAADYSPEFRYHCKFLHQLEAEVMELGRPLNANPSFLEPTCLAMARRHSVQCTFKQHSHICILSMGTLWKRCGCSSFAQQCHGAPCL